MKTQRIVLVCVAVLFVSATNATAYCSEPSTPYKRSNLEAPRLPEKLYCAGSFGSESTCTQWQVDEYNSQIRDYNEKIQTRKGEIDQYVRELQSYADDALTYAKCEVSELYK